MCCCHFGSGPFEPLRYPVVLRSDFIVPRLSAATNEVRNSEAERRPRNGAHGANRKPTCSTADARWLAQRIRLADDHRARRPHEVLQDLVRMGLTTAQRRSFGRRSTKIMHLRLTAAGRKAIAEY
jgi:hypothetical protein